jgi:hypothetical protein
VSWSPHLVSPSLYHVTITLILGVEGFTLNLPGLRELVIFVNHYTCEDGKLLNIILGGPLPCLKSVRMAVTNRRKDGAPWQLFNSVPALLRDDAPVLEQVDVEFLDQELLLAHEPSTMLAFEKDGQVPVVRCRQVTSFTQVSLNVA